jgi:hypothetical protein
MYLTFKQIKKTESATNFSKPNLSSDFKPKFFMVLGLVLMILFGIYWFMAKPDKAEKQRTELNNLKTKVKSGEELDENQRKSFCELLWLVEKTAVADCEKLTLGQMQMLIKYKAKAIRPKETILEKRFNLSDDKDKDFHAIKKGLTKNFDTLNFQEKANKARKIITNPDCGFWGENNEYLFFRPSKAYQKGEKNNFTDYNFFTFELIDSLK